MSISIGNFNIPIFIIASFCSYLVFYLTLIVLIRDTEQNKTINSLLSNTLFIGIIGWKISPLITSFETVRNNWISLLYLPGSNKGHLFALLLVILYVFSLWIRKSLTKKLIIIQFIFILLVTTTNFTLLSIYNNNREIYKIEEITNLHLYNLNNELVNINTLENNPIILNFWATWCPPCKAEIPELINFYRNNKNIDFYGINLIETEKEQINTFIKDMNISFPVYLDINNMVSNFFNITSVPTTLIVFKNNEQIEVIRHSGAITVEKLNSYLSLAK